MTRYELMKLNQSLMKVLIENAIDPKDVMHINLVTEYRAMKNKGHKVGYIVYHLSEKYCMSERGIYKLIDRMTKQVKL